MLDFQNDSFIKKRRKNPLLKNNQFISPWEDTEDYSVFRLLPKFNNYPQTEILKKINSRKVEEKIVTKLATGPSVTLNEQNREHNISQNKRNLNLETVKSLPDRKIFAKNIFQKISVPLPNSQKALSLLKYRKGSFKVKTSSSSRDQDLETERIIKQIYQKIQKQIPRCRSGHR